MANTYDAARIRDLKRAELSGNLKFGPWNQPEGWYQPPSWRIWKRFNSATLTVHEELTESDINASPDNPLEPGVNINETEFKSTQIYDFTATVPFSDFWRGAFGDKPSGMSFWDHWSRTAYGAGLYHAKGQIIIIGESSKRTIEHIISRPYDGPEDDNIVNDFTVTTPGASYNMSYESDPDSINGLATHCRMTADQALHSSRGFTGHLYTPWEKDPDGDEGSEEDGWAVEVYWSDTTLAMLASGSWTADMQLLTGAVSDDFESGGYHRKNFSRSGHFTLTFT